MLGACTLVRALRFVNPPWQCPRNAVQCMCDVLVSGLRDDSREGAGGVLSSGESASDGALLPLRGVSSYSNKRMDFLESIRSPGPFLPVPKVPKKGFDNVEKNLMGGAIKKRNHPLFPMCNDVMKISPQCTVQLGRDSPRPSGPLDASIETAI